MQVLRLYILSNVLLGIFCIVLYVCICILNDDISQYSSIYDERSKQSWCIVLGNDERYKAI